MPLTRAARRISSWIAILAILLGALAPAISHALASPGKGWVEVCTAQGTIWVAGDEAGDNKSSKTTDEAKHCAYCSFHAHALGILPSAATALPVPALSEAVPRAFLSAPRTLHAWANAQPRAPPIHS